MTYLDRTMVTDHRAFAAVAVALLQTAAIVGLISGLAVEFTPAEEKPPLASEQWKLTPPPPPPPVPEVQPTSTPEPQPSLSVPDKPMLELPARPGPTVSDFPISNIPQPTPLPTLAPIPPLPVPTPSSAARAARPLNQPARWVSTDDYPSSELRAGNQGTTRFRVTVGADGRVQGCVVTGSSGHDRLDAATCRLVTQRARFEPASGADGRAVGGSYSSAIRWVIPD